MLLALEEAEKARAIAEVPVGAVVVFENEVIGSGYNIRESCGDPVGHAEIIAIRNAAKRLGHWRLLGTTLYVTLEPCVMCAGAIVQSRIERLVFGAFDVKGGAVCSLYNILEDSRLNHSVLVESGFMEESCKKILKDFFRSLRMRKNKSI